MDSRPDFIAAFASIDRARLSRMDEATWSAQLDAREAVRHYVEALWQDVERSGENPGNGEKYEALAIVRDFVRSLTVVAFDVTHDGAVANDESSA
jgi:predicted DNA-binding transcriptional regulator YafY